MVGVASCQVAAPGVFMTAELEGDRRTSLCCVQGCLSGRVSLAFKVAYHCLPLHTAAAPPPLLSLGVPRCRVGCHRLGVSLHTGRTGGDPQGTRAARRSAAPLPTSHDAVQRGIAPCHRVVPPWSWISLNAGVACRPADMSNQPRRVLPLSRPDQPTAPMGPIPHGLPRGRTVVGQNSKVFLVAGSIVFIQRPACPRAGCNSRKGIIDRSVTGQVAWWHGPRTAVQVGGRSACVVVSEPPVS